MVLLQNHVLSPDMPALRNSRHERFAAGIAKGLNGADAYLAAGYALARDAASRNAYRLRNRQDVRERIEELSGKTSGRVAVEQIAHAIKMGRPTLYRPELCEMARRLALLGFKDEEIAEGINIDINTFYKWKAEHPEFIKAIQRGRVSADGRVAERAYHRALGYHHEAVKIFMPAGADKPVIVPYTERFPPDTTAAFKWLAKRQPRLWRDEETIRHTGTIEQRILAMSPEERAVEALALVERIKARLRQPDALAMIEHEHEEDEG
jgi:hypothetical protein